MTNEEAIQRCCRIAEKNKKLCETTNPAFRLFDYEKCASENIQVAEWLKDYKRLLEQEPCEDAISRQAAIETMGEQPLNWTDTPEEIAEEQMWEDHVKVLKELPSVTPVRPKSEWIPVSEELPENGSLVLTTIQVPGREPHVRSGMYFNGLFSNDNGDVWKAIDEEVKAWMPLPQPYKAESEEE